jgi:hypothetical protein
MPHPRHAFQVTSDFTPDDWRLLTGLPAAVMVATIRVRDGASGATTVSEGLAGLDAIAAGRGSDSALVRAVVAAIYAEPEVDGSSLADRPVGAAEEDGTPEQVFARCRRAVEVLRPHPDPSEAEAYLQWVREIAVRVCGAAHSGGVLGLGDDRIPEPQRTFLDGLAAALS